MALLKDARIKVMEEDRYGRKVAKVYVGRYVGTSPIINTDKDFPLFFRKSLNKALLNEGLAWHYEAYSPNNTEYKKIQALAKAQKKGIFRQKEPIPPWEWRQKQRARQKKLKQS